MPKPYLQGRPIGYSRRPLKGPLVSLAGLPVLMLDCSFRCSSSHFFSEHAKGNLSSGDANSGSVSSENKKRFSFTKWLSCHQTQKMFTTLLTLAMELLKLIITSNVLNQDEQIKSCYF